MELILAVGAIVAFDLLAVRYGFDSRPMPVPKNDPRDER